MKKYKKLLLVISMLSAPVLIQAQNISTVAPPAPGTSDSLSSNVYISINGGVSFPNGNVGSGFLSPYGGSTGGYSLMGATGNISVYVPIKHACFGIAGTAGYNTNPFDITKVVSDLNTAYYRYGNPFTYQAGSIGSGKEYNAMVGVYGSVALNKLSFYVSILGGVVYCKSPEIIYSYGDGSPYQTLATLDDKSATATSFGCALNFSLRYAITRHFNANLNAGFVFSSPKFTFEQYVNNGSTSTDNGTYTASTPISCLSLGLGIGYEFGK